MPKLSEKLAQGIVIFDGAMGTEIYRKNVFVNTCFESLNLTGKAMIQAIYKAYNDAKVDVITTNTFGANRAKLSRFGLAESLETINLSGVQLAREVANENILIAGSIGPIGELAQIENPEKVREENVTEQALILSKSADFLIFESVGSLADLNAVLLSMQNEKLKTTDYVVSMALDRNGESILGEEMSLFLTRIHEANHTPTALGLNCGEGPEGTLNALELMVKQTPLPIIVQPNAGVPKKVDDRMIYMSSPEYLATYGLRYINLGARGVGGCCGNGPEHILELQRTIRPLSRMNTSDRIQVVSEGVQPKTAIPLEKRSKLAAKLSRGEFVWTTELTPPRGFDLTAVVEKAKICKAAGIDAMNIPDGPRASSRLSPIVTAIEIQQKADIEVVLHCCCRDKNLIGMQADLLGCAAVNINNILFITGDPPKLGDYPFSSAVFDVDSIGMVKIQNRLNHAIDIGGKSLDFPTGAFISVGTDPNALDLEREIRRLHEKIDAGAELIITQPVFEPESLLRFLDKAKINVPIIAGIWPLASFRNAEFMKNEVPGVVVPDSVMKRMASVSDKEAQRQMGIEIAKESIRAIQQHIQGVQVSAPFGNVDTALAVTRI